MRQRQSARTVATAESPELKLRLRPVAAAAVTLLALSTAQAQTTETVTVTGIRASIENSINVKKNQDNIVEVISAEDIGKLPDASVAESVSRLSGVSVQRNKTSGKQSSISVRGMDPSFNGGLLNGREQASTGDNRGVEFDQFPAELLTSVVVYKTPDASLLGQGLASTIDMRTIRPLDHGKRSLAVNYRKQTTGIQSGGEEGEGTRKSFSYIDQFFDQTLGVAVGYVKFDDTGAQQTRFNSWGGWTPEVDYNGQKVKVPGGFGADTESTASDREGVMAVLQFKPSKNFESTLDFFSSKGKFKVAKKGIEGPVGGLSTGPNDSGGTLTNATIVNGVAESGTFSNFRGVIRNHGENYTDDLTSIGWGNKFKFADKWSATVDLSQSKVKRTGLRFETTAGLPASVNNANDTISFSGFNGSNHTSVNYTTGLDYGDANLMRLTNVQGWGGGQQDGYVALNTINDTIDGFRVSAHRDLEYGPIAGVEFGLNLSQRKKSRDVDEGAVMLVGGVESMAVPGASRTTAGASGISIVSWDPSSSLGSVYQSAGWTDANILSKIWNVKEKVTTTFAKGEIDGEIMGRSFKGNLGIQVAHTDQKATGLGVDTTTCNTATHSCSAVSIGGGKTYTDILPSLNLSTSVGNGQIVRLGLAQVLARPAMADFRPGFSLEWDNTLQRFKGEGGNAELEPFRAKSLDVSFERYFGNKAYFAIAGFYKKLDTYIVKSGVPFDFAALIGPNTTGLGASTIGTLTRPVNGNGGYIKGIELSASMPFDMLIPAAKGFGVFVNHSAISSSVRLPTSGLSTNDVGMDKVPLPGLSNYVTNAKVFYENYGIQVALAAKKRGDYLGEVTDYQDNRQLTFVKAETIVDFQLAYEFTSGWLKGLSVMYQIGNLTNSEFKRFSGSPDNEIEKVKYGKTHLLGLNYKL